jgi:PAS domain S-box-containing protein
VARLAPNDALREASGGWVWDVGTDRLYADARFAALCGLDIEAARDGLPTSAFVANVVPSDRLRLKIALAGVLHGSETFTKEYRVKSADGVVRWVNAQGRAERDDNGDLAQFTGLILDITEQKRIEERLRIAQTAGGVGTFEHIDGYGTAEVSEQFCRLLGLQPADALPVRTINAVVHPDDPLIVRGAGADNQGAYSEVRILRPDTGEWRWLARRGEHRSDGDGAGGRFIGAIYDITAAKEAEFELRELARTLEEKVEARTKERDQVWNRARDLFFIMSSARVYQAVNPAWKSLLGYDETDLIGRDNEGMHHPDDLPIIAGMVERIERGESVPGTDARFKAKDGTFRWINWTVIPEGGLYYGMGRDVTERKLLEDQLRQSQKMEAVGQLTGGLAHDFNNMLTGIMGSIDLARRRIADGREAEAERFLEAAGAASERAATLTHRLLAFSRRQTLDPQIVDPNHLVTSIEDLMRRTLGEQVQFVLDLAPELWPARTDSNQLESAILNLAINARDAMEGSGSLRIATRNVTVGPGEVVGPDDAQPGDYVVISVADTGSGIPPEVLAKVFEPFFTTKPLGQGTGLGLSMVYGFVRQSGGLVAIDSTPGAGTTVSLYLPRFAGGRTIAPPPVPARETPQGAGESVLLVEDDPQVRMLVRTVLEDLGYQTLEASDGATAVALLDSAVSINLLVSDVGLPGMNGRQLAEHARKSRPDLPVLFMTGYVANVAERASMLENGMQMISKPFSLDGLGRALREILGT